MNVNSWHIFCLLLSSLLLPWGLCAQTKLEGKILPLVKETRWQGQDMRPHLDFGTSSETCASCTLADLPEEWLTVGEKHGVLRFSGKTLWLKFTLENTSDRDKAISIVYPFAYPNRIELFEKRGEQLISLGLSGDSVGGQGGLFRLPIFEIDVGTGKFEYFIKIDNAAPLSFHLRIWTSNEFSAFKNLDYMLLGFTLGFFVLMLLYNLTLVMRRRPESSRYYILYILNFILTQLIHTGLAHQYLPDSLVTSVLVDKGAIFFGELTGIFGLLFSYEFLRMRFNSLMMHRFMQLGIGLSLLNCVLLFVAHYIASMTIMLTHMLIIALIMTGGIQACREKYRPAYYFLLSWGSLVLCSLLTMGAIYTVLPHNFLTTWAQIFGGCIEMTLLSFAWAEKFDIEKESMREENLRINRELQNEMRSRVLIVSELAHRINNPLNYISAGLTTIVKDFNEHREEFRVLLKGDEGSEDPLVHEVRRGFEQRMHSIESALNIVQLGLRKSVVSVEEIRNISGVDGYRVEWCTLHDIVDGSMQRLKETLGPELVASISLKTQRLRDCPLQTNIGTMSLVLALILNEFWSQERRLHVDLEYLLDSETGLCRISLQKQGLSDISEELSAQLAPLLKPYCITVEYNKFLQELQILIPRMDFSDYSESKVS